MFQNVSLQWVWHLQDSWLRGTTPNTESPFHHWWLLLNLEWWPTWGTAGQREASCMSRDKTKTRSSLGQPILNALIHISINAPKIQDCDEVRVTMCPILTTENAIISLITTSKQFASIPKWFFWLRAFIWVLYHHCSIILRSSVVFFYRLLVQQ